MYIDQFLQHYPIDQPRQACDEAKLSELRLLLPPALIELYEAHGVGSYRDGLVCLIDPAVLHDAYADFFGGDAGGRVPFLVNAFGEPVAYKRIGPREAELSILHSYGPKLEVLAYELGDFFDRILLTDDGLRQLVNVPLFHQLRSRLGKLRYGQSYGFDPALLAEEGDGAKADASFFEVVDTAQHLRLLYERASAD